MQTQVLPRVIVGPEGEVIQARKILFRCAYKIGHDKGFECHLLTVIFPARWSGSKSGETPAGLNAEGEARG